MSMSVGGPRGGIEPTTKDIYGGMFYTIILFDKFVFEYHRKTICYTRIRSFGSNIQILITC